MTYLDLIRDADRQLDKGDITLGEYEEMIEPLQREIDHIAESSKKAEGDCISRQTAIDCVTYDVEHTIECLKALPPAQPEERKKGAWILGFDNQYLEKYYFCSKCGSRKYMEDKPLDNFCPNCGADMRGEQDGRDD